jgi:NADH-quinone oxidoreductase B subunit
MNIVKWARSRSPWIIHFNTGSCNGCDIEVVAALTPKFDLERFGVLLKGSPRHADALIVTGPVTNQVKERLKRVYEQMPSPKFVMAIGTCACTGGVFKDCYNICQGVDKVIPVDVYVPGCAASPEAIIDGAAKLLKKISG